MVSICHHTVIYDKESFNFEMIYARYCKFISHNKVLLVTKRQVVFKAFERISVSFKIVLISNYVTILLFV